jgi:uncharacterized protein YpbB
MAKGPAPATQQEVETAAKAEAEERAQKKEKKDSKLETLALFKAGHSVEEIMEIRGLARSTVETHLSQFAGSGELDMDRLVPRETQSLIAGYVEEMGFTSLGEAKEILGEGVSYFELRLVMRELQEQQSR